MSKQHEKYQRLIDVCRTLPPTPTAVAHPCDESSLRGAVDAAKLGLIAPILVGPRARIDATHLSRRLFRRHIRGSSHHHSGHGQVFFAALIPRQSEVHDDWAQRAVFLLFHHHVGRLEVTVN